MTAEASSRTSLDFAIRTLRKHGSSIVLVKNSKVLYESKANGILPYVEAIRLLGDSLTDAVLADRIVGRAAALLSLHIRIKLAYAMTISEGALEIFANNDVPCRFDNKVPMVLNKNRTGQCPFELAVSNIHDSETAYRRIVQTIDAMKIAPAEPNKKPVNSK